MKRAMAPKGKSTTKGASALAEIYGSPQEKKSPFSENESWLFV